MPIELKKNNSLKPLINYHVDESMHWGYVALPSQLTTRYKRKLSYRNGMKGTAEIITADKRLAERLIATIRDGGK